MPTPEEIAAQKAGFVQVRKSPANELRKMRVQEVGLVPFGANARVFPIVKSDGANSMKIRMSGQALKTALGALQGLSEKVASTTAIAANAEVDDAAPPPAELGKLFGALGDMCGGLAKQYCGPGATMDEEEKKAARPFPGAAPPFGPKKKPEEDDGEDMKKAAEFISAGLVAVQKAGKKMAKSRFDALKTAHETIGKLLAEVGDAPEGETPPAVQKVLDAIVAKLDATVAKLDAITSGGAVTKSDAPLDVKAVQAMIEKSAADTAAKINTALAAVGGNGGRTTLVAPAGNSGGGSRTETKPPRLPDNLADLGGAAYAYLDDPK